MRSILFIDAFQQLTYLNFPMGINILSTIINKSDIYESEVICFSNLILQQKINKGIYLEHNFETIVNYILNKKPEIISFYTIEDSYFISLIVARNIKEINSSIKIIFAGPQASLSSYETMKNFKFIDMIAIGEGEQNIISIMDYFNNKENIENIKGICYRECDDIIYNENQPLIKNLDELPMIELDKNALPTLIPLETGRGCPYNCTFCCTKTFWQRKVRVKSIKRLVDEINYYTSKYGIKKFNCIHDLFTANKKHILQFCNSLINKEINIEWYCSARVDSLDEEIVSIMCKAGCTKIFLGIETGSQRMQKEINKHLDISKIKDTIRLLDKYNVTMKISFIYGFPTEKEEDLLKTMILIRFCTEDMNITEVKIQKCMCYAGTKIYKQYKNELFFNESNFKLFLFPAKNHLNFIRSYPYLFSSLFTIKNDITDRYFHLDIFINYIYAFLILQVPKTIKKVIEYYNDNLLKFYIAYEEETKKIIDLLTNSIYVGINKKTYKNEIYNNFESLIKNIINIDFISQLYEFEKTIIEFSMYKKSNDCKVLIFEYDMLLYYDQEIKLEKECKLIFSNTKNGEVDITNLSYDE